MATAFVTLAQLSQRVPWRGHGGASLPGGALSLGWEATLVL
jgi:hypothetical protein